MSPPPVILSVVTLNVWGLPGWIAKNKAERIGAIGTKLNSLGVDVICLQEVWVESDYQSLKKALQSTMAHSHYFYSGVTGSGTCIFTKWPIMEILFHQWPLNGYIHAVHHGDWFGGKGVGLVVLDVSGYRVNVYTTHLHAQYHSQDCYLVHRVLQAFDTAMFIKLTSADCSLSILAGDLNTIPDSLCQRLLLHVASLSDSYSLHDDESAGGTFDSNRNSYCDAVAVAKDPRGERIDYILYKNGRHSCAHSSVSNYRFPLEERVPGMDFSYSDHEAVSATFHIHNCCEETPTSTSDSSAIRESLRQAVSVCTDALRDVSTKSTYYWALSATVFCSFLVTALFFDRNVIHSTVFVVFCSITVVIFVFCILMAVIWCKMEFNGILGARERMVVLLEALKTDSFKYSSEIR